MVNNLDWTSELAKIRKRIQEDRAALNWHKTRLVAYQNSYKLLCTREVALKKCRVILQATALKIQKEVKQYIDNIVSMALLAVFENPYQFEAIFESKNNEVECRMIFKRDGNERDPLESTGGGAVDVAATALRAAIQQMSNTRPILILDEPFKFVSPDRIAYVVGMLQSMCVKLGIQIIMITNRIEFIDYEGWDRTMRIHGGRVVVINKKPVPGEKIPIERTQ
jgi:DNA repair exonuclease SbcCD ATPase subunit